MDNPPPRDLHLKEQLLGLQLTGAHEYWHRKRLLFNIIVGLAGGVSLLLVSGFGMMLGLFDFFGAVTWGLVANAFYSTGYVLDSWVIARSGGKQSLTPYRNGLFWLGTIAYTLVSIWFCLGYFVF